MSALGKKAKEAHVFERADAEWYVDPPSVSAALFDAVPFDGAIHDPCAGMGNIVRMARRAGLPARAADINPRMEFYTSLLGISPREADFFADDKQRDNIVANPPYGKALDGCEHRVEEQFILWALQVARYKVAVVLRWQWFVARDEFLSGLPLYKVLAITPRPSMLPGANIVAGEMPGGGAVDYGWFVFLRGYDGAPQIGHARRDVSLDKADRWTWRRGE